MSSSPTAPASGASVSPSPHSWGGEFRALLALGWPLVVAQLAQMALITTDVIMVGWLGPRFLAAAALANALFIALQLFGLGLTDAVAPLVAQALGARDYRSVRRTVRQGLWLCIGVAVLLLPVIWNIAPLYRLLGEDPSLIGMSDRFIHFVMWMIVPTFIISVLRGFLSAHGDTRIILWITLAGVVVNAVGDYALILGNWGMPRLELAGAGISTTVVSLVMLGLTIAYIQSHRRYRRYHIFHRVFVSDWPRLRELLRVGLPIGFIRLAEVLLFTSASLLQGWLGVDEVAAHAVALQLASITFMVPLGLSIAATVRVGRAYGEGDREGVRRAGWMAFVLTVLFMAATGICFELFPRTFVSLFLSPSDPANAKAISLAASYVLVAGVFQIADGTQVTMSGALRGLSDTRMPLVIALFGYWAIGFPVSYVLAFQLGVRGVGIWWGLASGLAVVGALLAIRFALRDRLGITRSAPA